MNKENVIDTMSKIFDHELKGVIRYTHYALMIFGPNRLPHIEFFRQQAKESSGDSRKLPGSAVLFSGVVAPTNEEMRTRASTSGIQHWVSCR